jgi:hypothetical protein
MGGANASSRFSVFKSNGSCGATHGANTAARRHTHNTMAETTAIGDRKLYAISPRNTTADHAPSVVAGAAVAEDVVSFIST